MILIGLTGSFGSGKTTVLKMFEKKGAVTLSADILATEAVEVGTEGYKQLVKHFGADILLKDQSLNRKKIAKIVFNRPEELEFLNTVTHAAIKELRKQYIQNSFSTTPNAVVIYESPLLFETHLEHLFQAIITVSVSEKKRLSRLAEFRSYTEEEVQNRLKNQIPQVEKVQRADFEINNSRSKEITEGYVSSVWEKLTLLPQQSVDQINL